MCIHIWSFQMLNKRAHILFDEKTYEYIAQIARRNKSTVGELVRRAIKKTYKIKLKVDKSHSLAEAAKDTFGAWKDHPIADKKLMTPLADSWSEPDKVF